MPIVIQTMARNILLTQILNKSLSNSSNDFKWS